MKQDLGRPSVSVIVPARNEEGNLKACVQTVVAALDEVSDDYEILIVNDGSTDGTGALADRLASELPGVRVIHNLTGSGFAEAYRRGLQAAAKEYVALIPGDNEIQPMSVRAILDAIGQADVVVPITANQEARPWLRRRLSRVFTGMVNLLFGFNLRYFQGPCVYRAAAVRAMPVRTTGYAFLTEMLVRSLAAGHRAIEVPMYVQTRQFGASRAVSAGNVITALQTLVRLIWLVHVRREPLK